MKHLSIRVMMIVLLGTGLFLTACNSGSKTEKVDKTGKEYTSKYICPMHCPGSGGDEPGKCSICGMDMIENKDFKGMDTTIMPMHDENHEAHGH